MSRPLASPLLLLPLLLLLLLLLRAASPAGAEPVFTDVTAEAGIDVLQHDLADPPEQLEQTWMSGGAAVADVDGDGFADLFVTRLDGPDVLYRNRGDGTFEDVSAAASLTASVRSNGAAFADVDNDGDPDLYVTTIFSPANLLYVNDGSGRFTEEAALRGADSAGIAVQRDVFSVSFGDVDNDGWIDLHTDEWFIAPPGFARLLRNRGAAAPGHFFDDTVASGLDFANVPGVGALFAFTSRFADLDGDGWADLAVAADFGTSRLFWNRGDGTFADGTEAAGVGGDENGMGSAIGDVDGDGDLDWFVTSIHDPAETCESAPCGWGYSGNRLYRNEGDRRFHDATDEAGVREGYWGWGTAFLDYDNDGDLDLVETNGQAFPWVDFEVAFRATPMRLWRNDGSGLAMSEVSAEAGLDDTRSGKGLLVFDYDRDGDLDLFVVNNGAGPALYRNDGGNERDWLRVEVRGRRSNRDGIGAVVRVRAGKRGPAQVREISGSSHFLAQSEKVAHFGLGSGHRRVAEVSVHWPASGETQVWRNVPRNSTLLAEEAAPAGCGLTGLETLPLLFLAARATRRRMAG